MHYKKNKFILIPLLALLITVPIISCSNINKTIITDDSSLIIKINLKSVEFDDEIVFPQNLILLQDSILIVYEPKIKDSFISVINTLNNKTISKFASIGESPDEFINPRILNDLSTCNSFCIGDAKKIKRFNIDSISEHNNRGTRILTIPQEMMFYNNVFRISDPMIVYSQTGDYPISIYDTTTERLNFTSYFPSIGWVKGSPYIRNMEVFANSMTSAGQNIAIAYHNWNIISIVTPQGDVVKELYFSEWDFNKERMKIESGNGNLKLDPECKIFFTKIRSNSNYIFALGWSDPKDLIKIGAATSYIYVMDWEGKVIKKLTFDKSVSSFCIKDDTVPYVIAMGEDEELHVFRCVTQI